MTTMISVIGDTLTEVLSWIGTVITAMLSTDGALAPLLGLFAVGICVSVLMLSVKIIRSFIWGA